MAISRCPECNDEVQIPQGASPSAIVECPWCSAEFELKRLLDVMPPVLIVKSDPDSKSVETSSVSINVAEQNDLPMFDFKEREAPQAESIAPSLNAPAVRRPRPQPKGSGLISAAAVLFGGLCAIPLAQLCLWWIFGQDPVEAGPTVAKYVAFVVPKQFRGNGPTVTPPRVSEDSSASTDAGRARQQPRDREPLSNESSRNASGGSVLPSQNDRNRLGNTPIGPDPNAADVDNSGDDSQGASAGGSRTEFKRPKVLDELGTVKATEVDTALQDVIVTFNHWLTAPDLDSDQRGPKLEEFYATYCEFGRRLALADPLQPEAESWLGVADQVLKMQLADEKLLNFFANKAEQLLKSPVEDATQGIVFSGTLESVQRTGDFWKLRVRLGDTKNKRLDVMGWLPPPSSLAPGDKLVILGSRVADPGLVGWESQDGVESLLGGYFRTRPAEPVNQGL